MSSLEADQWKSLLRRLNSLIFESDRRRANLPPEFLSAGWCGLPPASHESVTEAEQRLGIRLPPSYKSFLSVTNGWYLFSSFIERLFSVHEIDWLRVLRPDDLALIQQYYKEDEITDKQYLDYDTPKNMEFLRHRYYPDCLLVGRGWTGEGEMILLNSKIVFPDGEWEAIFFADWLPGNKRYPSFRDLVEATIKTEEFMERSGGG
jgi:SMI1/KNR4 family protein SUKH-1